MQNMKVIDLKTKNVLPWTKLYEEKLKLFDLWSQIKVIVISFVYATLDHFLMHKHIKYEGSGP